MTTRVHVIVLGVVTCASSLARADDDPEQPSGRFQIGAGYTPDDGFIAQAEVAQDDLFDTGQRLALTAELAERWQTFRIVHGVDDLLGSGLTLQSELFSTRERRAGFTTERAGGALTVSRQVDAATRVYLRAGLEQIDVTLDPIDDAAARVDTPAARALGDGLLATLRAGVVVDTLDAPLAPRRGHRVELYAEAAAPYSKLGASLDAARALGPFTLRVHGRATYLTTDDPGGVPLAFRLQHDGHADVRGYPLATTFDAGDTFEALGRVELELPVWPSAGLSLVGFADAGVRGATSPELMRSVGLGILWRSPIGPLRFDWAIPLDADDPTPQFLFSLGGSM